MTASNTAYCFDFDGTLSQVELLPRIASIAGIHDEIGVLTKATLEGVLNFESSFKLRVKLLSSVSIQVINQLVEGLPLNTKIRDFINAHPEECFVVTGNLDVWINSILKQVDCRFYSSEADFAGDTLFGIRKILNKSDAVKDIRKLGFTKIVAVGDGMNDAGMFEAADVRIAFGGVHNPVETLIELSDYITYHEDSLCKLLESL